MREEDLRRLNRERIFEISPGQTRFGRREFVGYATGHLFEGGPPFLTFAVFGSSVEVVSEDINKLLETYILPAEGFIHWRHGITVSENKEEKGWMASARLIVHPYLPSLN